MNKWKVLSKETNKDKSLVKINKPIKPPFGYFGSKNKIAIKICQNLPPHSCWVEAFCGSAAITLAKKPAPIEVINDIDDDIINFFRVLRNNPKNLLEGIAFTPYARKELLRARIKNKKHSNVERARKFLISAMMSVNGVFGDEKGGFSYSLSFSRNNRDARVNRWYNLPDRLEEVIERLLSVRVENRNALILLKDYVNRPATLIYLDPPYFAKRTKGYNMDANNEDFHRKLLELANKAKCMIFISSYDNELYRSILSKKNGWSRKIIQTYTKNSTGKSYERIEVVWMNKHFTKAQKLNRIPIRLTADEKQMNKINPSR